MDEYRKTQLFKKAEEIRELATAIVESAPDASSESDDSYRASMLDASKDDILANAYAIGAKIAGAYSMDLYDLQMENA